MSLLEAARQALPGLELQRLPPQRPIPTTPIRVDPPMPVPPDNCASVVERELRAEVERLQGLLEKVVLDAAAWPHIAHGRIREGVVGVTYINVLPQCPAIYDRKPCECGADAANQARGRVRAALGVKNV